jgi:hypothetical protein
MSNFSFSHVRGDTFMGLHFEILVNGVALNLTGAAIKCQLKKDPSTEAVLEFSTADASIAITFPTLGKFSFAERVINIAAREYVMDIEITLASGRVVTPVSGSFTVTNDITR